MLKTKMIKIKKVNKGCLITFTRWETWRGAGDGHILALTKSELVALHKCLLKVLE